MTRFDQPFASLTCKLLSEDSAMTEFGPVRAELRVPVSEDKTVIFENLPLPIPKRLAERLKLLVLAQVDEAEEQELVSVRQDHASVPRVGTIQHPSPAKPKRRQMNLSPEERERRRQHALRLVEKRRKAKEAA